MAHESVRVVREEELMRLLLAGYMLKECAAYMKLGYTTVRKYAAREDFLRKLKELSDSVFARVDAELKMQKNDITERLEQLSEKALDKLEHILETSTNEMVVLRAVDSALDRNNATSKTRKLDVDTSHHFLPEDLIRAAQAAKEVEDYER